MTHNILERYSKLEPHVTSRPNASPIKKEVRASKRNYQEHELSDSVHVFKKNIKRPIGLCLSPLPFLLALLFACVLALSFWSSIQSLNIFFWPKISAALLTTYPSWLTVWISTVIILWAFHGIRLVTVIRQSRVQGIYRQASFSSQFTFVALADLAATTFLFIAIYTFGTAV